MSNADTATEIRELVTRCDNEHQQALRDLANAVSSGVDADRYAGADSASLLLHAVRRPTTLRHVAVAISILRDLLFLAPIAKIWLDLRSALRLYGESDAAGESFFALWQSGFDGAGTPFSSVAGAVVVLLVAIGLFGVAASWLVNLVETRESKWEAHLQRLGHAADVAINSHLTANTQPIRVAELEASLSKTASAIRDAHGYVNDLRASIDPVLQALAAGVKSTDAVGGHVSDVAKELAGFKSAVNAMEASLAGVSGSISKASAESERTARSTADLATVTGAVMNDTAQLARTSADSLTEVQALVRDLATSANVMNKTMSDLIFQIERLDNGAR